MREQSPNPIFGVGAAIIVMLCMALGVLVFIEGARNTEPTYVYQTDTDFGCQFIGDGEYRCTFTIKVPNVKDQSK